MGSVYIPLFLNCLRINILGHKFTFGSPGKFEFSFSGIRPKSPTKVPKSPGSSGANASGTAAEDGSGSEVEEDEGEHIYFQVCYISFPVC
jgi:hypothetical protein